MDSIYGPRPAMDTKLPETFRYIFHPYGRYTLGNLKLVRVKGSDGKSYPALEGTVTEGSTTSYLFGHTSERSAVGQTFTVWGIAQRELDAGEATRVAM